MTWRRRLRVPRGAGITAALCLLVAAACESPTGVRTGHTAAPIVMGTPDDSYIVVALAERRVHVSFTSFGGGCDALHEVKSSVEGMTALIEPINRYSIPKNNFCTRDLALYYHTLTLQFPDAGPAAIRLRGRDERSSDQTQIITLEKVVVLE